MEADQGNDYLAQRALAQAKADDVDAWFDRYSTGQAPPPDATGADGAAAPAPASPAPAADPVSRYLRTWLAPAIGLYAAAERAGELRERVAADLGRGVIETPGAVVRGAAAAVENTFRAGDDLATWLNQNVVDLTVPVPDWVPGWAQNPTRAVADTAGAAKDALFDERQSVSGRMVEFASQWLTASAMGGRVMQAFGLPANAGTRIMRDFVAGAVGFDPKQPRLSNTVDNLAPNPITDYLKARDDDPVLLGRLKAGLETAGLGAVADGVIKALKVLKGSRGDSAAAAAASAGAPPAGAAAPGAAVVESASPAAAAAAPAALNAANENAVQLADDLVPKAAAFLKGEIADTPVQVNLARFEGPDQIVKAIGDLSRMLPETETIPMARTLEAARELGLTPADLTRGLEGGIFDRRQIAAGWMLFRSAAGELVKAADIAKASGAPADVARFNAAFQTTHGILQTVKGQSTEIARALQIQRALRQAQPDMVKQLQGLIDDAGGAQVALEMAERIALLADPAKAAQFVAEAGKASTRDQLVYAWSNALLSNPASHVANIGDTTLATLAQVPETWFASRFSGAVPEGEATARLYGIVQGMRDGWRAAGRAWRTGQSQFGIGSRVETGATPLSSTQDLVAGGSLRQAGDYLAMLIPTRVMQAGDELTKMMNYRAELHARAWRDAVVTRGLEGPAARAHADRLIAELPDWLQKAGQEQAVKGTFNEPLQGMAASLARSVDQANVAGIPVGRVIVPFVRTPTNLIRWAFHRTPIAVLSPHVMEEIAAGGATRDLALGRIAAGSTVAATVADLTLQGRITGAGPKDPELRAALMRTGWQPYSFKVGDEWFSYNRSGTLGSLIGIAADGTELVTGVYSKTPNRIDIDGEPVEDSTAAAVVLPFANAVLSKVYMQGLAEMVDALADPTRKGDGWFRRIAGGFVPAVVGAAERTIDPEIRRAETALEAMRARVYGEGLAPRLNLWGEPLMDENGLWNLFLPTRRSEEKGTPIDRELVRLQLEIAPPPQVLRTGRGGVDVAVKLSPELHNRLIQLAGNELKLQTEAGELGARDLLDAIVTGQAGGGATDYPNISDERRELMIQRVIQTYRSAARARLLQEAPDLRALVEDQLRERADAVRGQQ